VRLNVLRNSLLNDWWPRIHQSFSVCSPGATCELLCQLTSWSAVGCWPRLSVSHFCPWCLTLLPRVILLPVFRLLYYSHLQTSTLRYTHSNTNNADAPQTVYPASSLHCVAECFIRQPFSSSRNVPECYRPRRFITAFTRVRHWSLPRTTLLLSVPWYLNRSRNFVWDFRFSRRRAWIWQLFVIPRRVVIAVCCQGHR
jgi:hypothetical protein